MPRDQTGFVELVPGWKTPISILIRKMNEQFIVRIGYGLLGSQRSLMVSTKALNIYVLPLRF